jgi:cell division protein ZapE
MATSVQPQSDMNSDPLSEYEDYVKEGKLKDDAAQRQVIEHLQGLARQLSLPFKKPGLLGKLLRQYAPKPPRSIYIWGAVGRGKSMLMDIFYANLAASEKRRIHFNPFMQEVHNLSHIWRQKLELEHSKQELLPAVAHDIVSHGLQVLCLDELQVTDVADAMILSKLFTTMLEENVTFVITSNLPPEELYLGGLQREKFMEFVHLVYERMDVLELASPHDYRMQQIRSLQTVYLTPNDRKAENFIYNTFKKMTHGSDLQPLMLDVQGRKLKVSEAYGGIAKFSFAELCSKPLGAPDYIAIARRFHTVFVSDIPKMSPERRNEARRFVILIDTLYDHRVKLICSAETVPEEIYSAGDSSFEFRRTVSRLAEMQSDTYLNTPHIP